MIRTIMKTIKSRRFFNRVVAYFTIFTMLFPIASPAVALGLENAVIEKDLDHHPLFIKQGSTTSELYKAKPYVESFAPTAAKTVQGFYRQLWQEKRAALGEVTHVPVSNGGITFFIPTYNNPESVGTPLVQSRYVRAQISGLLGRNLIDSDDTAYQDETAQINTLYANARTYVDENPGLIYGTPLQLPQDGGAPVRDMIWPEERTIHGHQVMVPVVYLTGSTVASRRVEGHEVAFVASATFDGLSIDGVDIKAGRNAFINVVGDLTNNQGSISGGGELQIAVGGTLSNISGVIESKGDLRIGANAIENRTIVYRYDFGADQGGSFGEVATIQAGGNVTLRSYSDIVLQGAAVNAGGDIVLAADGNIYVGGVQYATNSTTRSQGWYKQTSSIEYLRSTLTAAESIEFIANGQIQIDGAELIADEGHINLLAGMGITIQNDWDQSRYVGKYKKSGKKIEESAYETVAIRALLDAGKGVTLHTEFGDINLTATEINASEGTEVTAANGAINLLVAKETDHYSYHLESKSLFTQRTLDKGHNIETVVHNAIVGGLKVNALYGLKVEYDEGDDTSFAGQIDKFRQVEELQWLADIYDNPELAVDWVAVESTFDEWHEDNRSLNAAAMAIIAIAVAVATGGTGFASLGTLTGGAIGTGTTATVLSAGWTSLVTTAITASTNAAVNGGNLADITEAAFKSVASKEGLKSLAVAMVTAGVMAEIDAKFFGPTEEQLSNAVDALEIGQKTAAQALAEIRKITLTEQLTQTIVQSTVSSGINSVVYGADFGDLLKQSLLQAGVNQLGQAMLNQIGNAGVEGIEQGGFGKLLTLTSKAAVGCIIGELGSLTENGNSQGDACSGGAFGVVASEIISGAYSAANEEEVLRLQEENLAYIKSLYENNLSERQIFEKLLMSDTTAMIRMRMLQQRGVDLSRLGAALGATLVGLEAASAVSVADINAKSALHTMAINMIAQLERARNDDRISRLQVVPRESLSQKVQGLISEELLEDAGRLGLLIKEQDGVLFVEAVDGNVIPVDSEEVLDSLIDLQLEKWNRLVLLKERLEKAEADLESFNSEIERMRKDAITAAYMQKLDAITASGITDLGELAAHMEISHKEEFVRAVEEGTWILFNGMSGGTFELALEFLLEVEVDTSLTDDQLAVLYAATIQEAEHQGIGADYVTGAMAAATFLVNLRDIKEIVDLGGDIAQYAKRKYENKSNENFLLPDGRELTTVDLVDPDYANSFDEVPPWDVNFPIIDFPIGESGGNFVRVYCSTCPQSFANGNWIAKYEDLVGLTPQEIQIKLALPYVPDSMVDVLPKNVMVRTGQAGANAFSPEGGGLTQYLILRFDEDLPDAWFTNQRAIGEKI